MKVLYFHQHFSTPKGPGGQRSYEMAKALIAKGHEVTMVCGRYKGSDTGLKDPFLNGVRRGTVDGIEVIEFDLTYSNHDGFIKRTLIFFKYALKSIKCVWSESYDLLFATSTPLTAAIPGIIARWFRKKPFVFEVRDLWPELPKAMGVITNPVILSLMAVLERVSYHSAHAIIALSPGMMEGIIKQGISKHRVHLISNGCDLSLFETNAEAPRPEGVSNDDLMLLYPGTHGIANGLDAVLDVALELKKRGQKQIKFVFVGDGKLKPELVKRAKDQGLDHVLFLEAKPKPEIAKLMATADLGMQILANVPAFYNGTSPNKFFDYLAAGLPVIMNYPGWLADKVIEHQCGFVVPPNDLISFADQLEGILRDKTVLKDKKIAAKTLAMTEFNRSSLAKEWTAILETVYLKYGTAIKDNLYDNI